MRLKDFQDPFPGEEGVYLFTTDHLEQHRLFPEKADFTYGVNTLALGTLKFPVQILCYTLMDNHMHILMRGAFPACSSFLFWALRRLAGHLSRQHGLRNILGMERVDVQPVRDDTMFTNEMAYILRNAYKARLASPFSYPWAPFEVYFNPYLSAMQGVPFKGHEEARRLLQTHIRIPDGWMHWQGRILNPCFVDYRYAEHRIGSGLILFDRIRKYDLESVLAPLHGEEERITFTDREMQEKILAICRHEYHVTSPQQLDRKTLMLLARSLARRFSCGKKQIARLTGIAPDVLDRVL